MIYLSTLHEKPKHPFFAKIQYENQYPLIFFSFLLFVEVVWNGDGLPISMNFKQDLVLTLLTFFFFELSTLLTFLHEIQLTSLSSPLSYQPSPHPLSLQYYLIFLIIFFLSFLVGLKRRKNKKNAKKSVIFFFCSWGFSRVSIFLLTFEFWQFKISLPISSIHTSSHHIKIPKQGKIPNPFEKKSWRSLPF